MAIRNFTIADNQLVTCVHVKNDNAGAAAGNIVATSFILRRDN